MMKVYILLSVIAVAFASQECGENQHYNSCGTVCPLTCDNFANPPRACVLMCNPGCHCDQGYVKTADGRCVQPEECPAKSVQNQVCGENERYSSCGTACPLTCDNFANPPKICVLMCKIGCECETGYVKSRDGRCVRPEECPAQAQVCGENARYTSCGTACPLTCDNFANPPKICPLMCKIGCECETGYVKSRDGRCVRPEECPGQAPIQLTCNEKAETGMCRAYIPMFNYDAETGKCNKFIYGGCGGNGNRYATESECLKNCAGVQRGPDPVFQEICSLPAETGLCRGNFVRYYYDKDTETCKAFTYGGCGGNENNFASEDICLAVCEE